MTDSDITTTSEFRLCQTEDVRTRIECRLEEETLWLTQAQMGELLQRNTYKFELKGGAQ